MMEKLSLEPSALGQNLYEALKKRVLERRSSVSEVASYLHFGCEKQLHGHTHGYFLKLSRKDLISEIKSVVDMYAEASDYENICSETQDESQSLLIDVSYEAQLSLAIKQAMTFKAPEYACGNLSRSHRDPSAAQVALIKKEMLSFESSGVLGKTLQGVYDKTLTVPTCTVEAERAFSVANNFCRKIRTRLSDRSLNALVFLQAYFKKNS